MEINELEYTSIFIESSENLGVLFDSYKKLGPDTESFLDKIEDAVIRLNKNPDEEKINLKGDITWYKNAISCKKEAEPIDIRKVKALKSKVKAFRFKLDIMLNRLARIKDKIAYGGNYIRAALFRPKVYGHNMTDEKYANTNNNIREVNRAVDWVEKAMIDLFNLADQDINILTIVDKMYASNKVFEGTEELPSGCYIGEDQADITEMLPGSADKISEKSFTFKSPKSTGSVPTYLAQNHDIAKWGEEDPDEEKKKSSLDDYSRSKSHDDDDLDDMFSRKTSKSSSSVDDESDETPSKTSGDKSGNGAVNYYYYTYQNSLNKNTDSFNKYNSDDHSTGKHVNSHNSNSRNSDDENNGYRTIRKESVEDMFKLNIFPELITERNITEDVGDADDDKPRADHPVRDAMIDADRAMQSKYQDIKKTGQAGVHLYRTATRPVRRVKEFINGQIAKWKDADETEIKERLADPNARKNIFHAIKVAIDTGAYFKAGILMNPIILGLHTLKKTWGKNAETRIKNEMILELQQELEIIDKKIEDADHQSNGYGDTSEADKKAARKAKYELMRLKTEVQKKLWRVTGANTGRLTILGKHKAGDVSKFL